VKTTYAVPGVAGSVTFSDGACEICAELVDALHNRAILSTASGWITVDQASGTASTPLTTAPVSENFAYDYNAQLVYAPFYGTPGGVNVIDLSTSPPTVKSVATASGASLGNQVDATAIDPFTRYAIAADESTGQYSALNFNSASSGSTTITAPAVQFPITASANCIGSWDAVTLEPSTHIGVFANDGDCVGIAVLPTAPVSGNPTAPTTIRWAILPRDPQAIPWINAPAPHSLVSYVGLDGRSYALALRNDQALLARLDLKSFQAATLLSNGKDSNQIDPATPVTTPPAPAVTFIPVQ
jgi:hypothetical protein